MTHILVVDDEVGARTLTGIMLERGGFNVVKVKDANEALKMLDNHRFDLIILDVMMAGMDGVQLCRLLRQRPDTAELPIIILSARGDAESVNRGIDAGATDYILKPILNHDLSAKVRTALNLDPIIEEPR
jgi:DNA-binding response OmpR family regulator